MNNPANIIEVGFSLGLFVNAALFIPQARRLLAYKTSQDVSLIMFLGFWVIQLFIVLHGFLKKDYLLMFGTMLSMVTGGTVIVLIIYYRVQNRKPRVHADGGAANV